MRQPVDVGGGIRFSVAQLLRGGKGFREICAALLHGCKDKIGGAVHNPAQGCNSVHTRNAQKVSEPRNTAPHGCRERKPHAVCARERKEFLVMQ